MAELLLRGFSCALAMASSAGRLRHGFGPRWSPPRISLSRGNPTRSAIAGSGQFTLHIDGKVYDILCEQGDLIGVPDGTRHWFDMSESPYFVAIRLFTNKEGWVASYTGDEIAVRFPRMSPPVQHP